MPITLDDLFSPTDYSFDFPDVPDYAYRYEDIPKPLRKNRKNDILTGIAQAMGGFDSGHLGQALAAAAARIEEQKAQEVGDYRQQQDRGFQARERQAEKQAQSLAIRQKQEAERQKAQRVLSVYQETQKTIHPADQASAARLDAAARALDIDEIQRIAQNAAERGSMLTQGINPDDPTAIAKYKHDQQIAQYKEQQDLQMQANIEQAKTMRELGLTQAPNDPVATAIAIQQGLADRGLGSYRPELLAKYLSEITARENRPTPLDPIAALAAQTSKDPLTGAIDEGVFKQNKDTLTRMLRGGSGNSAAATPQSLGRVGGTTGPTPPPSPPKGQHAAPTGPGGKPPVNPLKPPASQEYPKEALKNPAVVAKIKTLESRGVSKADIIKLLRQAGIVK